MTRPAQETPENAKAVNFNCSTKTVSRKRLTVFETQRNIPIVSKFIGKSKSLMIGVIKILIIVKTIAPITKVFNPPLT